jgi:anti-sigma B factor antagonist
MDFEVMRVDRGNGVGELVVDGEVDLLAAPFLKEVLAEALTDGVVHVVVNLSGATFVDSTTLGVIMGASGRVREKGGALVVVCNNPPIRTIFEITRLDLALGMFDSTEDAIASLDERFQEPDATYAAPA